MARGKVKADHRADNRGGPWAGLPHVVLDSLAYRHLSLWGRAVLIEIVRTMNGYNNGQIGISQRQIAERLHTSNFKQIGRAIAELMEKGFLDIVIEGRWKQGKAREYRLTFVNTGGPGHYKAATNEYRDWQPGVKSGVEPVSANKARTDEPVSANPATFADDVSANLNGKLLKTPFGFADTVSPLISKPYPGAETPGQFTGENGSQTASGLIAAAPDPCVAKTKLAVHSLLTDFWSGATDSQRRSIAKQVGITFDELKQFVRAKQDLSLFKMVAIRTIVNNMARAAA